MGIRENNKAMSAVQNISDSTIFNYANCTKRLIVPEEMDQSGHVT